MRSFKSLFFFTLILGTILISCTNIDYDQMDQDQINQIDEGQIDHIDKGQMTSVNITGYSLEANMVNESITKSIAVYLPPSYDIYDKSYPVLYILQGFTGGQAITFAYDIQLASCMDSLIENGSIKEMIVVVVSGTNVFDGSFYVNSPVTGNWEDFVKLDIVQYIDSNYRTIATANSRGITGHSMGGFGSFTIAMKNPDIFSAVYSISPGFFDENGLEGAMESWDPWPIVKTAYAAAFSPNTTLEYPYANIINSAYDTANVGYDDWVNGYGGFDQKISDYKSNLEALKGIVIDYGIYDSFPWIPEGCEYVSEQLEIQNIDHTLRTHEGDHGDQLKSQLRNFILPYFSETLEFE